MWIRLSVKQVDQFEMFVFQVQGWELDVLVSCPVILFWFPDFLLGLVH